MKNPLESFLLFASCFICGCSTEEPPLLTNIQDLLSDANINSENTTQSVEKHFILFKDCEIYDKINNRTWNYTALLPYNFDNNKNNSVLYLLHGRTFNREVWYKSFEIEKIIATFDYNKLNDLIIIMPDANDTYYVDDYLDNIKYETFFIEEFIPFIEDKFSISSNYKSRYIGGFSMGGYGALYYTLKYPDDFSFCYSISTPINGKGNPLSPSLLNFFNSDNFNKETCLILDIGLEDKFIEENINAHFLLESLEIPHEFILREGGHTPQFWTEALYILFDRLSTFRHE